jgi:hypothetical protein
VLHPAIDLVRNRALAWPAAPNAGSSNDLDRHKATLRMAKGPTAVASAAGEAGARTQGAMEVIKADPQKLLDPGFDMFDSVAEQVSIRH